MQEKNMGHICPIGRSGVKDIWKALIFFKDLNKNCDMMSLFLKTFKDISWTSYF